MRSLGEARAMKHRPEVEAARELDTKTSNGNTVIEYKPEGEMTIDEVSGQAWSRKPRSGSL